MDAQNEKARTGEITTVTSSVADGGVVGERGAKPVGPIRSFCAKCIQRWLEILSYLRRVFRPAVHESESEKSEKSVESEKTPPSPSPTMSASPPAPSESVSVAPSPSNTPPVDRHKHLNFPAYLPADRPFAINGRIINPVHTPTVEHCKQVIEMDRNTTLFHSGGMHKTGYLYEVLKEKRQYLKGYAPLCQKHTSHDFSDIYRDNPQAWSNLSQALAEGSSGTAYVLLPPGRGAEGVPTSGHFIKDEFPHLGPHVERLVRIRHDDPESREVFWEREPSLPLAPSALPRPATPRPAPPPQRAASFSSRYNLRRMCGSSG
ncbi:hypothetical protein PG997_011668 [Apiospora hydei]|uniref:Uncharacterized protein n=1 Tax=Apiospora hydei TaxID=1337664 RepID=A0ABR1VMN1_9PEZI